MRVSPKRERVRRLLLLLLVLVLADQAANRLFLADGELAGRRLIPYVPPVFDAEHRERLEEYARALERGTLDASASRLDPDLGWGPFGDEEALDWAGARSGSTPLPRERAPGVRRVVAVGDSYTFGTDVEAEEAWPALVARARADLEVANLGVGGYGLDQAVLRLRRDGLPLGPDEVWVGILPRAALRVTTVYPPAREHSRQPMAFKPRFALELDGTLREIASPAPDLPALTRLLTDQVRFFAATAERDPWVARCPPAWMPLGAHWTHHSAVARAIVTRLEARRPTVAEALADPASEVYRLHVALVLEAQRLAERAGARLRVWVFACRPDLGYATAHGERYWAAFTDELGRRGVEVHDLTGALLAAGVLEDSRYWSPSAHYGPLANALVAEEVLARLERER